MAAVLEAAAGADTGWTDVSRRSPTTVKYVVTNKVQQQLAKRDRVAGGRGELGKWLGAVAEAERQAQRQEWRRGRGRATAATRQLIHIYGIFAFSQHHFVM